MTRSLARAALVLTLLLSANVAFATPLTYYFEITATDGPDKGDIAQGTFTFDSSKVVAGSTKSQKGLFDDLTFTWNEKTYDETTVNTGSLTWDASGMLTFATFGTYCAEFGGNPCADSSNISGTDRFVFFLSRFYLDGSFGYSRAGGGRFSGSGRFSATPIPPPVPEPATLTMLGSGLVGLVAAARRRRSR